ncbi:MAG TPA: peptidylprolyl isomerase, partial [Gaiellales bacterium]|nr:peptidylprolyl isomerase [Gaiellales bacterium]
MNDAAVARPSARVSAASLPAGAPPAGTPIAARSRRRRRLAATVALSATAALLLSACGDSQPGTAAVVGDQRITDSNLQNLVDQSLSAPGARAALPNSNYKGDLGAYRRTVLGGEVERLLAEAGARKLGVTIDENAVDSRYKFIQDQSGGPDAFASQLTSRLAMSPALYRQFVRNEVIESEIGYAQGNVKRPTDAQLQGLYQQYLATASSATLSAIQVRSQAIAEQTAARLKSDPSQFDAVAARVGGSRAQQAAQPQKIPLNQLPADLVATLQKTPKGEIFPYVVDNGGAKTYLVIRTGGVETPTLEQARPQLEAQALQQATTAGKKYLTGVASSLGVEVNPRYGAWQQNQL